MTRKRMSPLASMLGSVALVTTLATTPQESASAQTPQAPQTNQVDKNSKPYILGSLLYTEIAPNFQGAPVRDVITHLATILDIDIKGHYASKENPSGIDPETPITLQLNNVSALTVLENVLGQCGGEDDPFRWQFRNSYRGKSNYLEVGSKESLAANPRIKFYHVDYLANKFLIFENAPEPNIEDSLNQQGTSPISQPSEGPERPHQSITDQLTGTIVSIIEPDDWERNGGNLAKIGRYTSGGKILTIRAPDYIHNQIGGFGKVVKPAEVRR